MVATSKAGAEEEGPRSNPSASPSHRRGTTTNAIESLIDTNGEVSAEVLASLTQLRSLELGNCTLDTFEVLCVWM